MAKKTLSEEVPMDHSKSESGENSETSCNSRPDVPDLNDILSKDIWSDEIDVQAAATTSLLNFLWSDEHNDRMAEVLEAGVLPRMADFLENHEHPELQTEAANVLSIIASGEHTQKVVDQVPISSFVTVLNSANQDAKNEAVLALGSISLKYRDHVLAGGALLPLLALFGNISGDMQHNAMKTLSELCRGPRIEFDITPTLPILLQLMNSSDEKIVCDACGALYHLLECNANHVKQDRIRIMINAGIYLQLVQLVSHPSNMVVVAALRTMREVDNTRTQVVIAVDHLGRSNISVKSESEAARFLANIASTGQHTKMVVDQGAISMFLKLLTSSNQDARKQAILGLGRISSTSSDYRDRVLAGGALSPLLSQFENMSDLTMQQNATYTLSQLCKSTHTDQFDVMGTLRVLVKLIPSEDETTLYYACRALYYLLEDDDDGKKERIQALIDAGISSRLMQLVVHTSNRVAIAALNTVGYVAKLDDSQTQVIIDSRTIGRLVHLLDHPDTDTKMKIEAAQAISRTVERESNQLVTRHFVDEGFIQIYCEMLRSHETDTEIVLCCLKVLRCIMDKGEEVKVLEEDGTFPFVKKWINPFAKKIQECGGFDLIQYISGGHDLPYSNDVFVAAQLFKVEYIPDYY